jgi:hypothetical protein
VTPYADALRDELVTAARRRARARRVRLMIGATAVAGVLVAVAATALTVGDDPPAGASTISVTRESDAIVVAVLEQGDPEGVQRDLRAAGVSVTTLDRRTGPSRIGTIVSMSLAEGSMVSTDGALSVRVVEGASVQLGVGVPAEPGTFYDAGTDALAVGEPLRCVSWVGQSTGELARAAVHVALQVIDREKGPVETLPLDKVVVNATAIASDRVLVTVDDGEPTAAPPDCVSATPGS